MLIKEIKQLLHDKELVSLELSDHDGYEITGFFLSISTELAVMQLIGNDGRSEGFTLFEPELIAELFWGNLEHSCIKKLALQKSQITPVLLKSRNFHDAMIELFKRYHTIGLFTFEEGEKFEAARLLDQDKDWLKLECYGTFNTLSNLTKMVRIDQVCRVEFGTTYLNDLALVQNSALNTCGE